MQKIKNIEFLRCFTILAIILFHLQSYFSHMHADYFPNTFIYPKSGGNGVEVFFIIAGFFLFLTFKNIPVWEFIKKKYFRLAPAVIISLTICAIASMFKIMHFILIPNIISALLLSHFGIFWCRSASLPLWYVSSLFFGLIVFYLIIKYIKPQFYAPIFIILGFGSYILLSILLNGQYNEHSVNYYKIICPGTLRAFGGIGVGCLIGLYYKKYFDKILNLTTNTLQNLLFSAVEFISFAFLIWWFYFKHGKIDNFIFILGFSLLFICFLFKKGILSKITDKYIWVNLSKYIYILFTIHMPIIMILYRKLIIPKAEIFSVHPNLTFIMCIIIPVISAVICYHYIEQPVYRFLSTHFLKGVKNA